MIDVDWRQPFIDYLSEQKVLSDKNFRSNSSTAPGPTSSSETSSTGGAHLPEYS
jgi:hypothetical protein